MSEILLAAALHSFKSGNLPTDSVNLATRAKSCRRGARAGGRGLGDPDLVRAPQPHAQARLQFNNASITISIFGPVRS